MNTTLRAPVTPTIEVLVVDDDPATVSALSISEIPYRCLTTPAVANLLVAGRCISASRQVRTALRAAGADVGG